VPKKDPHAPQMTPLEKMLRDSGPVRNDGSDKFFGMENVSDLQSSHGKNFSADLPCDLSMVIHGMFYSTAL
jgi:hypothetical protein